MRHVDDGTIHAWLDRQIADPAETASIEEHLRGCALCRARLAEAQGTFEQADALLAGIAPAADAQRDAFDALAARAHAAPRGAGSPAGASPPRRRTWAVPAAWAASVALAAALGWIARDLAPVDRPVREGAQAVAREEPELAAAEPAPAPEAGQAPGSDAERLESRVSPAEQVPAQPSETSPPREAAAITQAPPPAPLAQPPAPAPPTDSPGRTGAPAPDSDERSRAESPGLPAAISEPVQFRSAPDGAGARQDPSDRQAESGASLTDARNGTPAPAAVAPLAGRGAGGRGGRAGVGGGTGSGGGRVIVDGVLARRLVSRTEAAALSGMPLYGIEGLTPTATMVSADNTTVHTIYRFESGDTLEVTQQRVERSEPSAFAGRAQAAEEAAVVDRQSARTGATWSTVRDDVRLTLRGAGNLEALGERLRLD